MKLHLWNQTDQTPTETHCAMTSEQACRDAADSRFERNPDLTRAEIATDENEHVADILAP